MKIKWKNIYIVHILTWVSQVRVSKKQTLKENLCGSVPRVKPERRQRQHDRKEKEAKQRYGSRRGLAWSCGELWSISSTSEFMVPCGKGSGLLNSHTGHSLTVSHSGTMGGRGEGVRHGGSKTFLTLCWGTETPMPKSNPFKIRGAAVHSMTHRS